jgi:hypothetical protein
MQQLLARLDNTSKALGRSRAVGQAEMKKRMGSGSTAHRDGLQKEFQDE